MSTRWESNPHPERLELKSSAYTNSATRRYAELDSNQHFAGFEAAVSTVGLPAYNKYPHKESNPDYDVRSVVSYPLNDKGMDEEVLLPPTLGCYPNSCTSTRTRTWNHGDISSGLYLLSYTRILDRARVVHDLISPARISKATRQICVP